MKNNTLFLMIVFGSSLITLGSCTSEKERASNKGLAMDSASVAERANDALVLSTLKSKKVAAEENAKQAISDTKEAKRVERDATDAAEQADRAFRTEEEAQESRQKADNQARKSDKASTKADQN